MSNKEEHTLFLSSVHKGMSFHSQSFLPVWVETPLKPMSSYVLFALQYRTLETHTNPASHERKLLNWLGR